MDIEGLIQGLVGISRQPISETKSKAAAVRAAVTSVSDVGSLLSKLNASAAALDTLGEVGSFKVSSGNESAVAVSANGNAQPGSYQVEVLSLAQTDRRYSNAINGSSTALGVAGTLTLQIGTGDVVGPGNELLVGAATAAIDITGSDTLSTVIEKINGSGLRLRASALFDGSQYHLQIAGLDVGADNAVTVTQQGFDLGLNDAENIKQTAQDASMKIDGITVTSKTNQITQAIPGVTFALKAETTSPFTIAVDNDPEALATKLTTFVTDFNAVVNKAHQLAGYGSIKATNPILSADSTLRRVTSELSRNITTTFGEGTLQTLASIGVKLNNDGTLRFDKAVLDKAVANDPNAVSQLLAGDDSVDGAMDRLADVTKGLTAPSTADLKDAGVIAVRKESLEANAKRLEDQIAREEARLVSMEERLRKTFTAMDSTVGAYQAQLQSLLSKM